MVAEEDVVGSAGEGGEEGGGAEGEEEAKPRRKR